MKGSIQMPIRSTIDAVISTKGLKKKWIAEQMGISQSYLSQMTKTDERGFLQNAISAEYLLKIAHVIGCDVNDLVKYEEE